MYKIPPEFRLHSIRKLIPREPIRKQFRIAIVYPPHSIPRILQIPHQIPDQRTYPREACTAKLVKSRSLSLLGRTIDSYN